MRRTLALLALVTAMSCGHDIPRPAAGSVAEEILGTWDLAKIDGGVLAAHNIQDHALVLERDGTWRFVSTMTGPGSSMTLQGSGTWVQASDGFHFARGDNTQRVTVRLHGDVLRLEPDPVLSGPGGSPLVDTEYHRSTGQADPALQPPHSRHD